MNDFLIEVLDYNESVLTKEVVKNTTKDLAIEFAVLLCEKTTDSYCFNLELIDNN